MMLHLGDRNNREGTRFLRLTGFEALCSEYTAMIENPLYEEYRKERENHDATNRS